MSEGIAIRVRNAGVCYRRGFLGRHKYWALRNVSFELKLGETLGVIGQNGAGKSTLLKLLAGVYEPDVGSVDLLGHSIALLSLQVGFMPHLTGRENAILSGILLGMRRAEVIRRMDEILEFTGLQEFIDEPLATYSSGMRARLGFGVAFLVENDVLLIDEVLGVGDVEFRKKSTAAMKERIRSKKTVVLVTHSPETIASLCDRVVWIRDGETYREGLPGPVLEEYMEHFKRHHAASSSLAV